MPAVGNQDGGFQGRPSLMEAFSPSGILAKRKAALAGRLEEKVKTVNEYLLKHYKKGQTVIIGGIEDELHEGIIETFSQYWVVKCVGDGRNAKDMSFAPKGEPQIP